MDKEPGIETGTTSSPPPATAGNLSLQQVVELGEYKPEYLQNFAEWHLLSPHVQWQFIRKALDIRHRQLITQYAELNNALFLSQKPEVQAAMKKMEQQLNNLANDKERLYVEYTAKF
ncbi:MAG: hypothetical protein ABIO02_04415 [Patescibacteria group bacterium]